VLKKFTTFFRGKKKSDLLLSRTVTLILIAVFINCDLMLTKSQGVQWPGKSGNDLKFIMTGRIRKMTGDCLHWAGKPTENIIFTINLCTALWQPHFYSIVNSANPMSKTFRLETKCSKHIFLIFFVDFTIILILKWTRTLDHEKKISG